MFLHYSMTASPTATNLATPSSSGPKVTARGRSRPTYYQPHRFNRMSSVRVAGPLLHKRCSQWFRHVFRTTDTGKCCATSPASAVPSVVSLTTPPLPLDNPTPLLYPVVFPGVNTGGVGSYIYDKESSAVTQPWASPSPLSLVPPRLTTPSIDHSITRSPPSLFPLPSDLLWDPFHLAPSLI